MSGPEAGKAHGNAPLKEIIAWAMYDVANSTYGTVVATAVYNAYFVNVIAGPKSGVPPGMGTVLLTINWRENRRNER